MCNCDTLEINRNSKHQQENTLSSRIFVVDVGLEKEEEGVRWNVLW